MLSDTERSEIEQEYSRYPTRRAVCVDAMKIVQQHRGWVSDEAIGDIAELLTMSPSELDGVATFYNIIFRYPVGRHVVRLCDSVSCWVMGYEKIRRTLRDHLGVDFGDTMADGRFTVLPNVCLGACDRAPVLMVDGDLYLNVDADNVEQILRQYE